MLHHQLVTRLGTNDKLQFTVSSLAGLDVRTKKGSPNNGRLPAMPIPNEFNADTLTKRRRE
jgi:hypothetical protein